MTFQNKKQIKDTRLKAYEIHSFKGVSFRRSPETMTTVGGYDIHPMRGNSTIFVSTKDKLIKTLEEQVNLQIA